MRDAGCGIWLFRRDIWDLSWQLGEERELQMRAGAGFLFLCVSLGYEIRKRNRFQFLHDIITDPQAAETQPHSQGLETSAETTFLSSNE